MKMTKADAGEEDMAEEVEAEEVEAEEAAVEEGAEEEDAEGGDVAEDPSPYWPVHPTSSDGPRRDYYWSSAWSLLSSS